ncbi:SusC/RagA family TonB-linked outer membrane protein [Faecalibacter sp. LW9]|uniref:SusC/RagA family TonB-linked outer membrane protein n=1 Tax=Faecalibacter sp. LW9 TaxID=3103144 RepID=UPI002AFF4646|nr:SusC/RagA family TonB-linked outer membrane protein [Faecalibacter sp. LW9]
MRRKLTSLSLLAFLGFGAVAYAQTSGTVNDKDGFPEMDVPVQIKGTNTIVYTDENGEFSIDAKVGDILIINGKEVLVTSENLGTIETVSATDNIELEETVITAFGVQKKETVVGSNIQIKSEDFENRAITNATKALEGTAAGVQFSTGSGQPGDSNNIRVRGFSSYTLSNSPLYVVDGAIYSGVLSDINPSDIESITVLKDAASTSLYGSSAANGVIMITTKKGKKGKKGQLSFSANTGVVVRGTKEYDRVSAKDYYELTWAAMRNGFLESTPGATLEQANLYASENLIDYNLQNNIYNVPNNQVVINGSLNPNAVQLYDDFNWQKYTERVGVTQRYDIRYSGATESSDYSASLGYNNEEGYLIASDYERYTARVSANSQATSWLKLGTDISGIITKSAMAEDGGGSSYINPFYTARFMGPIYSPFLYDEYGNAVYDSNGNRVYDGVETRGRGTGAGVGRNVIQETLLHKRQRLSNTINSRAYATITLAKGLTLTGNVAYDVRNRTTNYYQNKVIGDAQGTGAFSVTDEKITGITLNQILTYKKSFGLNNFQIDLGHESYERKIQYLYTRKTHEVVSGIYQLVNFLNTSSNTGYQYGHITKESYFGRINYDYNNKYLLSGSIRQDQSSRFDPANNKGVFWSAGAGWNLHREDFLKDSKAVNLLKLRSSYGEVGNDGGNGEEPGYNADLSLYELGYNNAGETGILLSQIGNKNLTWEANSQFDVALEFGFFNNRISGTVEYYERKTEDMIFPVPTPGSAGVPGNSIYANIGAMQNKGFEVLLNLGIIRNENFSWDVSINASTLKNKITKLPDGQDAIINGTKRLAVGQSIYDFWLIQYHGVDPSDGRVLYVQDAEKEDTGDTRIIDGQKYTTNHNNAQFAYSGSAIPDVMGGFQSNFSYKGFYLNTMFSYQIGGKVYDSNYAGLISTDPKGAALHVDMLNAWQNPGDITNFPKMSTLNEAQNLAQSSRWLVDADYLSLRSATFGYTFNRKDIESIGLSSLKIYVTGENLVNWTKKQGLEPVQSFNGTTSYRYSPARIVSLGLNVNF